jgi:hypothetical protein
MAKPNMTADRVPTARVVERSSLEPIAVLGPLIQYITEPNDTGEPCVMIGTIPPQVAVPLHSHDDPEIFIPTAGVVEALVHRADDDFSWVRVGVGQVFHVVGGAKHAFRNPGQDPAVMYIVSTMRIGRFFRELGEAVDSHAPQRPPSPEALERFLAVAQRYGYWNATSEENARVGIVLPRDAHLSSSALPSRQASGPVS